MSIKKFFALLLLVSILGCSKKPDRQQAKNYHHMSLLELRADPSSVVAQRKAYDLVEKALEADEQPEYLASKATLLFKMGDTQKAEALFEELLSSKKLSGKLKAEITNNYACVLAQGGKIEKAKTLWLSLTNNAGYLTPEVALCNLGKLCAAGKQPDAALRYLEKATRLMPGYVDAHYYKALVHLTLKEYEKVRSQVATVLLLAPEHQGAQDIDTLLKRKEIA